MAGVQLRLLNWFVLPKSDSDVADEVSVSESLLPSFGFFGVCGNTAGESLKLLLFVAGGSIALWYCGFWYGCLSSL